MTDTIIRLTPDDYDEAIPFLNAAFGKTPEVGFDRILPGIYQPVEQDMAWNYAVKRDGRLAAVVGLFPYTWRVGDVSLRIAGIGGVSVGQAFRKQGLMRLLMDEATAAARSGDYDFSYLGGLRQRYRYWGWERAGSVTVFHVNSFCAGHHFGDGPTQPITLEKVDAPTDAALLDELFALHNAQPSHCERARDRFDLFLRHWLSNVRVARDSAGKAVGYMLDTANGTVVNELVAATDDVAEAMLHAAATGPLEAGFALNMQSWPTPLYRSLSYWTESMQVGVSGNWQVLDWPKTVGAFAALRHATLPLSPAGKVVIAIEGEATFALEVGDGVTCTATDSAPDITLDASTAVRALFGPLKPSAVAPLPAKVAALLDAWCPLPLHMPPQDHV